MPACLAREPRRSETTRDTIQDGIGAFMEERGRVRQGHQSNSAKEEKSQSSGDGDRERTRAKEEKQRDRKRKRYRGGLKEEMQRHTKRGPETEEVQAPTKGEAEAEEEAETRMCKWMPENGDGIETWASERRGRGQRTWDEVKTRADMAWRDGKGRLENVIDVGNSRRSELDLW